MEAVFGLLLMLLRVSHGVESRCDGRQDGAACHGTLGGTLRLRLMDSASETWAYEWSNEKRNILSGRKNLIIINIFKERSHFTPESGIFQINNLTRSDSGRYTLILYNEGYKKSGERSLTLSIQAPVTSVRLTNECLSLGSKRLNCSSEQGDDPQHSWTLDGRALTDEQLLDGTGRTDSVTLKVHVLGQLECRVHNHVSNVSKSVALTTCGFKFIQCTSSNRTEISEWVHEASSTLLCAGPTAASTTSGAIVPILAGVLVALVVLTVVIVAVIHKQKRSPGGKTKEEEDDEGLTYADVRSIPLRARPARPRQDVGVEYGQVKFSERPRQTETSNDHCVYSEVRNVR